MKPIFHKYRLPRILYEVNPKILVGLVLMICRVMPHNGQMICINHTTYGKNTAFSDWYDYNPEHSRVIRGGSYELGIMQKTTYVRTGMYYRGTAGFRCIRMISL
jgi:hypothetical protein